jgi:hypothetical protein
MKSPKRRVDNNRLSALNANFWHQAGQQRQLSNYPELPSRSVSRFARRTASAPGREAQFERRFLGFKRTFPSPRGIVGDAPKPVIELTAVELLEGESWRIIRMQQLAVLRVRTERTRKGASLATHLIAR